MNKEQEHIIGEDNRSWHDAWKESGTDALFNDNDMALFEMTGSYTRALSDLEEVKNDPGLAVVRKEARKIVTDFKSRAEKLEANEKFITNGLSESDENNNLLDEIKKIKLEINEKQINELTADWVKEWHENRQQGAKKEEKKKEIRNFITSSLEEEKAVYETAMRVEGRETENDNEDTAKESVKPVRRLALRYISFSAAAAIALFFVINSLLPSAGPDKLYSNYYKPFNIVSPVTRNAAEGESTLDNAITLYKHGDYKEASAAFSGIISKDTSLVAPRFYFAMSEMAEGDPGLAINFLVPIVSKGGEYSKEASWYLGLAYLKAGEKNKARNCFETLAGSTGFYSDRAEKLLRRLR